MRLRASTSTQKQASRVGQAGASVLGCQWVTGGSLSEGAVLAAGRSLPDMSLAFALLAAINGSTGSRATLSYGLFRDQASSASARRRQDFHRSVVAAQATRVTVL